MNWTLFFLATLFGRYIFLSYNSTRKEGTIMEKSRKDVWIFVISASIFVLMVVFIVSMIISMIGGNWETMVQSSAIMTVWTVDLLIAIMAFTTLIISIIAYNID